MRTDRPIKIALWIYFWLLLFEGVLRKWVFPGFSDVLFIIRDPLVVMIYLMAARINAFPIRLAILVLWGIATISLGFAMLGDSTLVVTMFGMRTNYLHPPLIFVMGAVLDRKDVIRFGRWTILAAVPIIILMVVQFNSEPDARVNVGVGGSEVGQLRGALGKIRPPGPFSFISGVVSFFSLMMSFVVYGWVQKGVYSRLLVLLGSAIVVVAVPVSISRSLLFALLIVGFFGAAVAARDVQRIPSYLGPLMVVLALSVFLADTIYVQAFLTRWQESIEASDAGFYSNVVERILEQFVQPFELAANAPPFGHGVGLGTVAGARLMTGQYTFLLAESELARMVLELGPFLGFAFILWRGWAAAMIVLKSWFHFRTSGDALAWLLAGASFLPVLSGQWGPSTTLGFAVFGGGLALGALNEPELDEDEEEDAEEEETDADDEAEPEEPSPGTA